MWTATTLVSGWFSCRRMAKLPGANGALLTIQLRSPLFRSQLLILNTSLAENGSYVCTAENRAGSSRANYTLVVESLAQGATVMEMKMEHFVAVSACVISLLLLLLLIISVLLVQSARRHLRPHQVPILHTLESFHC